MGCEECGNDDATVKAYAGNVCTDCAQALHDAGACENCGLIGMHADYCSAGQKRAEP